MPKLIEEKIIVQSPNNEGINFERRRRLESHFRREEENDDFGFNEMIYSHNYNNLRNSNDNIIDDNDSSFDIHKKFCFQKIKEILEKFPEKIIDDIEM